MSDKPIFAPSTRRYVPMRHLALAQQLGGTVHPGLPTGVYIEIVGSEHSGKTSLTFALIDAVINQPADAKHTFQTDEGLVVGPAPRKVLFLDFESALDIDYMRRAVRNCEILEVDERTGKPKNLATANVIIARPDLLDEGIDVLIELIQSQEIGLAIVDSIPAMLPKQEHEKSMGENTVGILAREMGKFLRKTTHLLRRNGTTVVLINQWRDKIGVSFGDPRTTPGGKAAGYFESIKLDISGAKHTPWFPGAGKMVRSKSMKNKVTGFRTEVEYHLSNEIGLSAEVELTEAMLRAGMLENRGPNSPVKVTLPNGAKVYETRAEWLAALRSSSPQLFSALQRKVIDAGFSEWFSIQGSGTMPS